MESKPTAAGVQEPQLQAYLGTFEALKGEAARLAEGVPEDAFNRKPGPDRWSAAECLVHLTTTGRLLLPNLDAAIRQGRADGRTARGPFRYGPLSRWFIRAQEPGGQKVKTPRPFRPAASGLSKARVLGDFLALQDAFIERIRAADGLDLKRLRAASGATRLLRLSVGAWFEATAAHERRHLLQAKRALAGE